MLTNTKIKRLVKKDVVYREFDFDGLYIEVRTSGKKFWRLRIKNDLGKWTMKSLGEWPDVSIEQARRLKDTAKKTILLPSDSFEAVAEQWLIHQNYKSKKNEQTIKSRIERFLLPTLGNKVISKIGPSDILPIFKSIEASGKLELAKRVRITASQIFRYGVVNLLCESDPAGLLKGATRNPERKSFPAITDSEKFGVLLQRIFQAEHISTPIKFLLCIAPYVFLRSGEIRVAKKTDINLKKKIWIVPSSTTKMTRDHVIPLTDSMIEILENAMYFSNDEFLFPGQRKGRPISENTLNVSLRSLGYEVGEVCFHGFRSSFATLAREELRLPDELIERQLAHVEGNAVKAAYDRSHRLEERRELMQTWSDYLDQLRKTS